MYNKYHTKTPHVIAEDIGNRLKQARLNQNLTQAEVAEKAGVDRRTVIKAEKGITSLEDFIAILDSLDKTGQLVNLLPEQSISPIQLLKLQGKRRERASSNNKNNIVSVDEEFEW
ncbi:helix-turn-helix protein [compost metagenome]